METRATPRRPGGLTAICVIAIVLGGLGLIGGCVTTLGLVAGSAIQSASSNPAQLPGADNPAIKAQQQMQKERQAVAERWKVVTVLIIISNFVVSAGLLAGAIGTLRISGGLRRVFMAALLGGVVYSLVALIPQIMIQRENQQVVNKHMGRIFDAGQAGNRNAPRTAQMTHGIMQVTVVLTLIFVVAWALLQTAFYAVSLLYLRRQSVAALFDDGTSGAPGEQTFGDPPGFQ